MTLQGKLFANASVTIVGILLIGAASLIGFVRVERSMREVTDNSTPYQMETLKFTKMLQEHANALMEVAAASSDEELDRRQGDLKQGMVKLKSLESGIHALRSTAGVVEMGRAVTEVEGLTQEIIRTTRERVRAENHAAASEKEAHEKLRMLADDRLALQGTLKKLQSGAIANLTRSTWRSRSMTEQFRAIERIKDLFQGLEAAYGDIERAATPHDVDVAKGRIFFAIDGIQQSGGDFPSIDPSSHKNAHIDSDSVNGGSTPLPQPKLRQRATSTSGRGSLGLVGTRRQNGQGEAVGPPLHLSPEGSLYPAARVSS